MNKPETVRLATQKDEAALFDLLVELHRHNGAGWGFAYRPALVREVIECATRPDPQTRTNPANQRRGIIGVIEGPEGKLIGTVGIFLDAPFWYSDILVPMEIWLYVRPEVRGRRRLEVALRDYAVDVHEKLRPSVAEYKMPFPMLTGYIHDGGDERRFRLMGRLWQRLFPGARPVGMLFWRD